MEHKATITMAEVSHALSSSSAPTILNITLTFSNVLKEGVHYQIPCYSAYGYAARSTGGEQHIVSKGSTGSSSGSAGTNEPTTDNNESNQTTTPPATDTNTSVDLEKDIQINDKYLNTLPNITYENIKTKYTDAVVKNSKGEVITSGNLGTGYTVSVGESSYKIVKKGDTNGDGNITIVDAVVMLNSIKGTQKLENEFAEAAAVKNGDTFNVTDTILLLNYIKGTAKFTL